MKLQHNPWPSAVMLCAALAALAWNVPFEPSESSTRKIQLAGTVINSALVPLVDLLGREVLVSILGVIGIYSLLRALHIDLSILGIAGDSIGSVFGRQIAAVSRRDELEGDRPADLSAPPRGITNVLDRARQQPTLAVSGAGVSGAPSVAEPAPEKVYEPHPLGDAADIQYLAACHQLEPGYTRADMQQSLRGLHQDDRPLTDEMYASAVALIDEWNRRITAPENPPAPVAIVRRARKRASDWDGGKSWLGGAPRLGGAEWPRGKDGKPLHFVAQLDCRELRDACPESDLPHDGSLAYFIGDGAVIYVPAGDHAQTAPPEDLAQAYVPGGQPLPETPHRAGQQLFPYWPVDCLRLDLPEDIPPPSDSYDDSEAIWEAQNAALRALVPQQESPVEPAGGQRLWWRAAHLFADQLMQAHQQVDSLIAVCRRWNSAATKLTDEQIAEGHVQYESKAEQVEALAPHLLTFARQVQGFAAGRDPWEEMTEEEADVLAEAVREARNQFEDIVRYHVPHNVKALRNVCFAEMMRGDERMFNQLPADVRERYNLCSRLPRFGHQVFGLGACIQTNLYDHLCDHLLLQIAYDSEVEMGFGDVGIFQFWISPEALAAGEWHKAELTFECH